MANLQNRDIAEPVLQGARDQPVGASSSSRPLTTISSSATLCHLVTSHDEPVPHATTNSETKTSPSPSEDSPDGAATSVAPSTSIPTPRQAATFHAPDIISYFDPASVGGGGPLKRITTQQRERADAEARLRAEREAQGLPPLESGILQRFRSASIVRKPKPTFITPLQEHAHHEEDAPLATLSLLSPSISTKTLAATPTPGKELEGFVLRNSSEKEVPGVPPPDIEAHHVLEDEFPDGGYGWVVIACCVTLSAVTMGSVFLQLRQC